MMPVRTIIDTNLWISCLISPQGLSIEDLLQSGRVVIRVSEDVLTEFIAVASRTKFRKYFSLNRIQTVVNLFEEFGELVPVVSAVHICRDAKDNFLLALALDGNADFLVSGDDDLLVIGQFEGTTILTISEFASQIVD